MVEIGAPLPESDVLDGADVVGVMGVLHSHAADIWLELHV